MNIEKTIVVFLIEKTQSLKMYLGDLMEDYIKPMIIYFSGGVCEENDVYFTQTALVKYCIVFFGSELSMLESMNQLKSTEPTTSHKKLLKDISSESYSFKNTDRQAYITEAMHASLRVFTALALDDDASCQVKRCLVLITQSVPMNNPWVNQLHDTVIKELKELKVKTSIISAHKLRDLYKLYEKLGGDLQTAAHKNYATKPQHLVLLNGINLPERAISPSLMPQSVTNAQTATILPSQTSQFLPTSSPALCGSPLTTNQQQNQMQNQQQPTTSMMNQIHPNAMMANAACSMNNQRSDWQMGPGGMMQANQAGGMQTMVMHQGGQQGVNPQMIQGHEQNLGMVQQMNRPQPIIWNGSLDWTEEKQGHGGGTKVYRLPCKMTQLLGSKSEMAVKTEGWPSTLHMFFAPKNVLGFITGNNLLTNSTKVNFIPEHCPALDNLTTALSGNVGCVQLSSENTEIKMILLVLSNTKKAFVGFIPTEQAAFVGKMSHLFNLNRQRNPGMPQGNFKINPTMVQQQQQQQQGGGGQIIGVQNQMMTQGMNTNQQNIMMQNQIQQQMNPGMGPNTMVGGMTQAGNNQMSQMTGINPNQNMNMVPSGQMGMGHMSQGGQVQGPNSTVLSNQLMRPSMPITQQQPTDQINVRQPMQQQANIRQMQRPVQMMNNPRVMQNQAQSQGFRQMLHQRLQQQQQQQQQMMMMQQQQQQQQQQQGMRSQMGQPQQVMNQQSMGQPNIGQQQPMPQQAMNPQAMNQQGIQPQAMGQSLQDDSTEYLGMM